MITIMTTLIVALISPVVFAGERTVTVPTPKSITLVCSDDVRQGTIVLSNPPKFSCKDYDLVTKIVGTGITVGPDANVNRITAALRHVTRRNEFKVTKKDGVETHDNGRTIVRWRDNDNSNNHNSRNTTETPYYYSSSGSTYNTSREYRYSSSQGQTAANYPEHPQCPFTAVNTN